MKFRDKNTLAYFNAASQVKLHDLSGIPTAVFSESTKKYRASVVEVSPNDEAVSFYTLNHCASIVRKSFTENEVLPTWAQTVLDSYTNVAMAQGERMLHYILSITTREMRHLNSYGKASDKFDQIEAAGGPVMRAFIEKITTMDESKAVQYYMNHPPNATIGQYIKGLSAGFWKAKWNNAVDVDDNTGYGGPKWGRVADAALEMLHGHTSMEMLVDTGYTLAHNGGPIFNKGMMYSSYDGYFMTILDVQRSGQLPDLMMATETYGVKKTPEALQAVALIGAALPGEFKGYVDWKLVDELRPEKEKSSNPGKYSKAVTAQKQPTKKVAKTAKAKAAEFTTLLGKKVKQTGVWQVFPNQEIPVYERVGD